jgi:protein O-GlcNAc transferase
MNHRLLQQALQAHQSGDQKLAEQRYLKLIKAQPTHAQAHYLLGLLYRQTDNPSSAIKHLKLAKKLQSQETTYTLNLVNALLDYGQLDEAQHYIEQQLLTASHDAEWLRLRGDCALFSSKFNIAQHYYEQSLEVNQSAWLTWFRYGVSLQEQQSWQAAEAAYYETLKHLPADQDNSEILYNLGNLMFSQHLFTKAIDFLSILCETKPLFLNAWIKLADTLQQLGQLEKTQTLYQQALEHLPQEPALHNRLGNVLLATHQREAARTSFEKALNCDANYSYAIYNLALLDIIDHNYSIAINKLDSALAINPLLYSAVPIRLHLLRQCCRWNEIDEATRQTRELFSLPAHFEIAPFSIITLFDSTADEQRLSAKFYTDYLCKNITALSIKSSQSALNDAEKNSSRIRIGYLSADFQNHATAILLIRTLELHNREKFELFAYSTGMDDGSAMRQRIVAAVDRFYDVSALSDRAIAEQIAADNVAILLDLKGYTQHSRSAVLAYRPAPIQVNYLGYPATMDRRLVDYIIADNIVIPTENDADFNEVVLRLPHCYQPNDNTRLKPERLSRSECNLPENTFIFGAFHQNYKLSRELVGCWLQILKDTSNSVLWCLAPELSSRNAIVDLAEQLQVDKSRIIFADRAGIDAHLARLSCIDLMLDAFPVNGHTTTADALWMGVPVLTCAGNTFISRVAASLLHSCELDELVTTDLQTYQEKAIALAQAPENLQRYKHLLSNVNTLPLFDSARYTRDLDALLSDLYTSHC